MGDFIAHVILTHVLKCGRATAKAILSGERRMTEHQKNLVEEYNKEASETYRIEIPNVHRD